MADYWFEDPPHFKGFVRMDDLSISLLEAKVKYIRRHFEITKEAKSG